VDKALGALPVIAEYSRRLDLAGIIDRVCPVRDMAIVTHGQVIEALVANRLTSPTPMVAVADWAREWATPASIMSRRRWTGPRPARPAGRRPHPTTMIKKVVRPGPPQPMCEMRG
jgi:hypothetical protein